jgi:hypothetical protein
MNDLLEDIKEILESNDPNITVEEAVMPTEIDDVDEPFHRRTRTDEELADYDAGFGAAQDGKQLDETETVAWQGGWAEAQE